MFVLLILWYICIHANWQTKYKVDSISTNEALRFDTNSKSHALDIAKAKGARVVAAISTKEKSEICKDYIFIS